jgi:sugar lactone lactonase YvrE
MVLTRRSQRAQREKERDHARNAQWLLADGWCSWRHGSRKKSQRSLRPPRLRSRGSIFAFLWLVALSVACSEPVEDVEPARTYEAGAAVCEGGPAAPSAAVYPKLEVIGTSANAIVDAGEHLWIVESTDNSVSRYEPAAERLDEQFVYLGGDRNPWQVFVDRDAELAWITNWVADTLTVASTETGEVVAEISAQDQGDASPFDAPQGIAATARHVYVTNTAYRGPGDYGEGFVTVVDRQSREVIGRIDTAHRNPSFVRVVDTPSGEAVVVVNTGDLEVTDEGAFVRTDASVELWREGDDPAAPERDVFVLETTSDPRMGAPGQPAVTPDGRYVYLASTTAPVVFKFNLHDERWVRATDDPIVLYDTDRDATHGATIDSRGVLYVTALNEDALYLVDTTCDALLAGPIDLGTTDTYVEGPQDLRVVEGDDGPRAYFVTTLSSALGMVELGY